MGGGGEERVLNKVLCGEAPPRGSNFIYHLLAIIERKGNLFHTPTIDTMHLFSGESAKDLSKYLNDRVFLPVPYSNSRNPYPFIYLQTEKGASFGWSVPV